MTSEELRRKFLDFFKEKGHSIIPSSSLVPENDPTVLFTTAGMHPLVPFLLGEKHPAGKRLANAQACIRTGDIEEVGDEIHHTFFEMLGNWSLGDYWKKEAIEFSYEFLTNKKWLGLNPERLAVSIFAGDNDAERDEESAKIWRKINISEKRIAYLQKEDNWWGPAGQTGPCGPDTEMFYWSGKEPAPEEFDPKNKKWVEIWNDVFLQYFKDKDGKYKPLSQKNVDTGMGLERMLSAINGLDDDYKTDVFWPIIKKIEELSGKKYEENKKEFRIIADHIKAATFILTEKLEPSNVERGYVLRRLIRRAVRHGKQLGINDIFTFKVAEAAIEIYKDVYLEVGGEKNFIINQLIKEEEDFEKSQPKFNKMASAMIEEEKTEDPLTHEFYITGAKIYDIYGTTGAAGPDIIKIAEERGIKIKDRESYEEGLKRHQELSRTASAGMFKGGLADAGEQAVKYHTATHLLLAALRRALGEHALQKGSNITAERLRFDFSHPQKMTDEEIKKVENIVNQKIAEDLPVVCEEITLDEAKKRGATGVFENKYGEKVKVYTIKDSSGIIFSQEICGGPHVGRTGKLGHFKIQKEESSSAGVRRIRAQLQ